MEEEESGARETNRAVKCQHSNIRAGFIARFVQHRGNAAPLCLLLSPCDLHSCAAHAASTVCL